MEYRTFGRTALLSSVVGLGTWAIGGIRYGRVDDGDSVRAVGAALDAGITCFDTAPTYGGGHSEELLGRALGARRAGVVIVTKGGLVRDAENRVVRDSRRETLETHLERSLRRLATERAEQDSFHVNQLHRTHS